MSMFNPLTAALDAQRETTETATETLDRSVVGPDRLERMREVEVGQTPSEVVYTENKLELLHYEPMTEEQHDVPILIVYALINKPYILDLQPDRSVVRRLLEAGHDVYLIDWNEPSRLDKHLTLDDYVNRYIDNCVDVVRDRSREDAINILGYCMGGTMSAMYAALHREKVRTLGLMAAGLCFAGTGGVLEQWGSEEYYDPDDVRDAFGNMPAEMLEVGFALMDPVSNYVSKYVRLMDNLENEDFVDNFARMEKWLSEGIDVAGDAYVQFLTDIYQDNKLYNNELYLDGKHVDVTDIDMPVLQIMGEYDHLIPAESSAPFNDVVGSEDVTTIEYPTGHIGLSVSGSSHRDVWPKVAEWYFEKSPVQETEAEGEAETEPETESEAAEAEAEVETDEAEEETGNGEIEAEPSPEPAESEAGDEGVDPAAAEGEDLEEIEGIGPTYAARLREGGIETIADLATAEAEVVADLAEIGTERARLWVDRAQG